MHVALKTPSQVIFSQSYENFADRMTAEVNKAELGPGLKARKMTFATDAPRQKKKLKFSPELPWSSIQCFAIFTYSSPGQGLYLNTIIFIIILLNFN